MPKLFTRFGKLKRTADLNSDGLGLGLTIVKQIVDLAGGEVNVHSDGLGQGSTFNFTMKLQAVNNSDSSPSINSLEVQEFDRREVIPPEGQTIKLLRPFSLQKDQTGILKKESDQTSRQSSLLQKSSNETDQVIRDVFYRSYNSITFREEL